ncbi:MAG: hypothetical protein Q4B22_10990, partial [Eubacteriales bacterium]|nr:hypothetical protein [Eubacteriales bacterium]
ENVLGVETFRPQRVIYLCPPEIAKDKNAQQILRDFFQWRGLSVKAEFVETSLYKADHILLQLRRLAGSCPDAALDVTGGTDAALFAAGMFCREANMPAFTYSRKNNRFYDINQAPFADRRPCRLQYRVEDFFRMTGGTLRKGRVDNRKLDNYLDMIDPFFSLFLENRRKWNELITFMQRISQSAKGEEAPLQVSGSMEQKGEHGSRVHADPELFRKLKELGLLTELDIREAEQQITFAFADQQVRFWLRDTGSVLELYMYKVCRDSGIFGDVISSAIVDWDGTNEKGSVSNEIDVVASRGVVPVFISCKACEIKTEALNELAILRDRFGGKGAKAIIAATENCNAAARHRAAQLGIAVIDLEELETGKAGERIRIIMK